MTLCSSSRGICNKRKLSKPSYLLFQISLACKSTFTKELQVLHALVEHGNWSSDAVVDHRFSSLSPKELTTSLFYKLITFRGEKSAKHLWGRLQLDTLACASPNLLSFFEHAAQQLNPGKKWNVAFAACAVTLWFLVLLDDVWSAEMLDHIRKSLPHTVPGSRVIVTIAFEREKGDYIHEVGLIDHTKAKMLFMAAVPVPVHKYERIPPILWDICGGLPLAIVQMAGRFACNPQNLEDEWLKLCSSLQPSPGTGHTAEQLMKILISCYNDMPVEIKTCSFYLTILPRGKKISRKRLTRRWIPDGAGIEQQGFRAEGVAEAYLNHLIRRKILGAVEYSSNGKVKSYQVHDMVLENIASKASENNFVTTIGGSAMPSPNRKIRRLSVQCSVLKYEEELEIMNLSHVRDLTMFGSMKHLPSSLFKFRVVQVLDLEGCKDFKQHHTNEICRMLLLKYLSLRGTDIKKLTRKIGCLREYLETLDIRETNVTELPKTICMLKQVVSIFGGDKRTGMALKLPEEMGRTKAMKALRILSGIEISEERSGVGDFHHLTELRKLAIYKLNISKEGLLFKQLSTSIKRLHGSYHLRTLAIHEESSEFFKSLDGLSLCPKFLYALEMSGKLVELPKCIAEMHALKHLTLSVTALRADNLGAILRYPDAK
ncbi:disease resistance protein Pik-2-like [Triticum dicoccoides]|uniref:disease resistance protein Pik-2-like n=1 Tax=Triticum dicoccoides TaxID=85692 RepID=UPI00189123AC|nr:disease resistance protein Pik-2-like [Triticum dicoccoides]